MAAPSNPETSSNDVVPSEPESSAPVLAAIEPESPEDKPKRSLFRRVLRFLLVLVVGAAVVAAAAWFGWPWLQDRYIEPVESNTEQLAALEAQVAQIETQLGDLESSLGQVDNQISEIEMSNATLIGDAGDLGERLEAMEALIDDQAERIDELDAATSELGDTTDEAFEAATREIAVLRSMELLSRARLFLYQANYGLAAQDLQTSRDVLAGLELDDDATVEEALFRIDLALGALPDRPVAAADDLDIAWQALLGAIPQPTPTPAPSSPTTTAAPAP